MPNLYAVPAGVAVAECTAAHILATISPNILARSVLILPTRRACVAMRQAFQSVLGGGASLLPRMYPLSDLDHALPTLLAPETALEILDSIPPAMPDWKQRYLLATQALAFERRRMGAASIADALALADDLVVLQDNCARSGVTLTSRGLRALAQRDVSAHWDEAFRFLSILCEYWPEVEREQGMTIAASREVHVIEALAKTWEASPPDFPVYAIGSTASQEATACLLAVIASMPHGHVVLPGLDTQMPPAEWGHVAAGHPLFHIRRFLMRLGCMPHDVCPLGDKTQSLWMQALTATDQLSYWKEQALPAHESIRLVPCCHVEEEARVVSLLLREGLEGHGRTALVTPDEGFMDRVAAHMKRFGITVDRLSAGTLAATATGRLWMAMMDAIVAPERLLHLRHLLHHPLVAVDRGLLRRMEPYWYGMNTRRPGQLPRLPEDLYHHDGMPLVETLVREVARLSGRHLSAPEWVEALRHLLSPVWQQVGEGHEAVEEALAALEQAAMLGPLDGEAFRSLMAERLAAPWRSGGISSHPQLTLLTPIEARMQHFDRVILARMQESIWPGLPAPNAWLNLAAQKAVGLPIPEEHISLMAHDVLMLGSASHVFLTYSQREQGSPSPRSRFIERLVTLLATHGIEETQITVAHYVDWATMLGSGTEFSPERPVMPRPSSHQRPRKLRVSEIDRLFSDPFSLYARHVLGLTPLKELDAEPEASDFGNLAHEAIRRLTEHWTQHARAADQVELADIAEWALRHVSDRANIALFWRTRLLRALSWVNRLENERRGRLLTVQSELPVEAAIALTGGESVTLHGRIDRLETEESGYVVVDYKTGVAPSEKEMLEGKALQLLAYAMILESLGAHSGADYTLEYWALPRGSGDGDVHSVAASSLQENTIPERLCAALADMLHEATPFLACPSPDSRNQRYQNDYDGISRYDEWAG